MKLIYSVLIAICCSSCLLLTASCSGSKSKGVGEVHATGVFTTDSVGYTDSVVVGKASGICSVSVMYPDGKESVLVDSVRGWIGAQLNVRDKKFNTGEDLVRFAVKQQLDSTKAELDAIMKDFPDYESQYDNRWNIGPMYESEKVLTYYSNSYCYMGGAHGGTLFKAVTFKKDNGESIGWNMFKPSDMDAVKALVKTAVGKDYFKAENDSLLEECLLVKLNDFPFPAMPPVMVKEGVLFSYQQYEIAPYAAGMPHCVIPYPVLAPYFSGVAADIMPKSVDASTVQD